MTERGLRRLFFPGLTALFACFACGCGATTLRVTAAPTLDTEGHAGFESLASLGVGWPLDFHGRSHHFVQARAALGGGLDGRSARGMVLGGAELDYIHWAEPSFDVRAGLHVLYRWLPGAAAGSEGYALGAHVGAYPAVLQDLGGWLVSQLLVGPELRVEYVNAGEPRATYAQFSLPLVIEGTFLGAGD